MKTANLLSRFYNKMSNEFIKNFPVENEIKSFEQELFKIIDKDESFLKEDIKKFMFSNPKRLRPIVIFLISKMLEIENSIVMKIAIIIELIHSASLIHDDILDDDDTRRNIPALYKIFGYKKATIAGDLLLSLALNELSETKIEIVKIISDKIHETIIAELKQNEKKGVILPVEKYYEKTFNKTGNLFMAGLLSLFELKQIDKNKKDNLQDFIYNFSLAFQIKNDIENIEKKNMSDIKNGNYTLAVIYFDMDNQDFNLKNLTKKDLKDCIEKANETVKKFKVNALDNLKIFKDSIYKDALINLCGMLF